MVAVGTKVGAEARIVAGAAAQGAMAPVETGVALDHARCRPRHHPAPTRTKAGHTEGSVAVCRHRVVLPVAAICGARHHLAEVDQGLQTALAGTKTREIVSPAAHRLAELRLLARQIAAPTVGQTVAGHFGTAGLGNAADPLQAEAAGHGEVADQTAASEAGASALGSLGELACPRS